MNDTIKNKYYKWHYENRDKVVPADIADWWLSELSRLDQERVEKVREMFLKFNPESIEFSDPVKVDGWNECLSAVLTNVFNVEK